jgi:diaminopimelate decarboxylase
VKSFCIVDAAMNDLARPALYQAWMHIAACTLRNEPPQRWDIVGPVCESGDWLGHDRMLSVEEGDFVAVLSAGAYAMSMASNYNSRGRGAEVMVSGAEAWLIRDREPPAELFRGEHLLPVR